MSTPPAMFYSFFGFCALDMDNLSCFRFLFPLLIPKGQIHLVASLLSRKVKPLGRLHNCSPAAVGLLCLTQGQHFIFRRTK